MAQQPPFPSGSPSPSSPGLSVVFPSWHDPDFIGPLILGTLLQFGIFCILLMQAVLFFARQGHGLNDGRLFKLFTAVVLVCTTLQVAVGVWRIYNICVLLRPWDRLPHAWFEIVLNSTVVECVHGFFIFRCYKLSRSKPVMGLILVLVLAQTAAGIVVAVSAARSDLLKEIRTSTLSISATTMALDTALSVTLFVNLWRKRTGGDVDTVILRIIRITVESIVPCVVCVVFVFISVVHLGTTPLGSLFPLALPLVSPLYANALLTSLNSRPALRRQLNNSNRDDAHISSHNNIQFAHTNRTRRTSQSNIHQSTGLTQGSSMSYDVPLADTIELSSFGGSGSEQISSKGRPLVSDDGTVPDLRTEYSPTLSSKRARSPSGLRV